MDQLDGRRHGLKWRVGQVDPEQVNAPFVKAADHVGPQRRRPQRAQDLHLHP
jgi:hypothetical protein